MGGHASFASVDATQKTDKKQDGKTCFFHEPKSEGGKPAVGGLPSLLYVDYEIRIQSDLAEYTRFPVFIVLEGHPHPQRVHLSRVDVHVIQEISFDDMIRGMQGGFRGQLVNGA